MNIVQDGGRANTKKWLNNASVDSGSELRIDRRKKEAANRKDISLIICVQVISFAVFEASVVASFPHQRGSTFRETW